MQSHIKLESVRSSWLNCALRGDEAVYWVSEGQQWLAVLYQYRALLGQWRALMPLYIEKMKIWSGDPGPDTLTHRL